MAAFDSLDVFKRENIYYAKLRINGKVISENFYLAHPLPNIRMPAAKVVHNIKDSRIKIKTDNYAHQIVLELPAGVDAQDNCVNILPGETKEIELSGDRKKFNKVKINWFNSN